MALNIQQTYANKQQLFVGAILIFAVSVLLIILANISDFATLNSVFLLTRVSVIVFIILAIGKYYYNSKNLVLIYLLLSITPLLGSELFIMLLQLDDVTDLAVKFQLNILISNILLMISLFFFLLFFESFNSEHLITKRNAVLLVLVSVLSTGLALSTLSTRSRTVTNTDRTQVKVNSAASMQRYLDLTIYAFIIASIVFIFALIILILRSLNERIKASNNKDIKRILKQMRAASILVMIGPILPFALLPVFTTLENHVSAFIGSSLLSTIGLGLLFYVYKKGGIFLLQDERLRRIIIINKAGAPIYSYKFREFNYESNDNLSNMDTMSQEILFSGALQSISALLSEFSGSIEGITGIQLHNLDMIIKQVDEETIILLTDKTTKFYQEALHLFAQQIKTLLNDTPEGQTFSLTQEKVANAFVENTFGYGYLQQIGEI